jgi:hypothetical protein
MKGKQIKTLKGLRKAKEDKRAVFVPKSMCFKKPMPAAFAINLTGEVLYQLFSRGMFIYKKPKRRSFQWKKPAAL